MCVRPSKVDTPSYNLCSFHLLGNHIHQKQSPSLAPKCEHTGTQKMSKYSKLFPDCLCCCKLYLSARIKYTLTENTVCMSAREYSVSVGQNTVHHSIRIQYINGQNTVYYRLDPIQYIIIVHYRSIIDIIGKSRKKFFGGEKTPKNFAKGPTIRTERVWQTVSRLLRQPERIEDARYHLTGTNADNCFQDTPKSREMQIGPQTIYDKHLAFTNAIRVQHSHQ